MNNVSNLNYFLGQGFSYVYLRGKAPFEQGWQKISHTEAQATYRQKQERNLGVHTGQHSNNIIWIDLDERFVEFIQQFPRLCATLHVFRENAPDRGKVAVRITDTLPASTNFKPIPNKPPVAELLSTGRQAAVIGKHPSGEFYQTNGFSIIEMTFNEISQIWHEWTGKELSQIDSAQNQQSKPKLISIDQRKEEAPNDESHPLIDQLRQHYTAYDIFDHFGMVGDVANEGAGFIRILGNGGLLVGNPNSPDSSWKWFSHSASLGGDIFDAWYFCKMGEKIPHLDKNIFKETLYEMAKVAGLKIEEEPIRFTDKESQITHTVDEWIELAKVVIIDHKFKSDSQLRTALGALQIFERGQNIEYHISSRHLADLTGLSHRSIQKTIRWLCPEMLDIHERKRREDLEKAETLLSKISSCNSGNLAFRLLKEKEQEHIIERMKKTESESLYSVVIHYITDRVKRIQKELAQIKRGRERNELLDLLIKTESSNGVFANTYSLNLTTLAQVNERRFPQQNIGCAVPPQPLVELWKPLCGLEFIAQYMRDDAFIYNFIPREIVRDLSDQKPDEGWTTQTLMNAIVSSDGEKFLKSFGPSGPHILFELTFASHTTRSLAQAIGMHEGSLRRVIKCMSERIAPIVEKNRVGRHVFITLSDEWEHNLALARRHMFTDGVVHHRTIRHTLERIKRIRQFLPLITDEELKAEYIRIKTDAQKLLDAVEGNKRNTTVFDVSNLLLGIENDLAFVDVDIRTESDFYAYISTLENEDAKRLRYILAGDSIRYIEECRILANRLGLSHLLHLVIDVNELDKLTRRFREGTL